MYTLRLQISILLISALAMVLPSCKRTEPERTDVDSAARKIGREAYKASEQVGKGLKKAGKELGKDLKEASEGWKEAQRESQQKKK